MSSQEISCPRGSQCDREGLRALLHEAAGTFQYRKGRMPFIEVTNLRLNAESNEQSPSTDSKQFETQLRPAAIQLTGNAPVRRIIGGVIAVEQVELHAPHLDLPDT
jgi:hypothetical protein